MARLSPYIFSQEFDNNGNPLSGGLIYTYEAGTSTPKVTYADSAGTIPNPNPIVLDASGRYVAWLDSGAYKFTLRTSDGVLIETKDDIAGDTANAFGSSIVTISGNLAITTAYRNNVIIATAAATLTLLPASSAEEGFYFVIKNTSASANVTIDPNLAELIDGVSTVTVRPNQAAIVICNGTGWNTLFLDSLEVYADGVRATGSAGLSLKNSGGTTVLNVGAGGGTGATFAGGVNAGGEITATGYLNVAGTSSSPAYITMAEDTDNGTNKATIIAPASIASDYTLTLPSTAGTLARTEDIPTVTAWVAYTPVLTGVGAATGVEFYSRRVGDTLEIRGKFTAGTTTATEARLELGFNGTSGGITSAGSTKLPSGTSLAGMCAISVTSAVTIHSLIERSLGYITFGVQTASAAGLTKQNGTFLSSGQTLSVQASVPITGW